MDKNRILTHVAIIMDGNRRWARERGLPTLEGHREGYRRIKEIGEACLDRHIPYLSVFAFSTENWNRTEEEVGYLIDLFERAMTEELAAFGKNGVRICVIGRREELRPSLKRAIETIERETATNTRATFAICLNYGGRVEILDACRKLLKEGIAPDDLTEEKFRSVLYSPDIPDPDLIIRTSGEERLSGFWLWQSAYSELYWSHVNWPDFSGEELDRALRTFEERKRRFGA